MKFKKILIVIIVNLILFIGFFFLHFAQNIKVSIPSKDIVTDQKKGLDLGPLIPKALFPNNEETINHKELQHFLPTTKGVVQKMKVIDQFQTQNKKGRFERIFHLEGKSHSTKNIILVEKWTDHGFLNSYQTISDQFVYYSHNPTTTAHIEQILGSFGLLDVQKRTDQVFLLHFDIQSAKDYYLIAQNLKQISLKKKGIISPNQLSFQR